MQKRPFDTGRPITETIESYIDFDDFKDTCSLSEDWTPCCDDAGDVNSLGDITPDFLRQLAAVNMLLERTGLPVIKLLSFWGDISTAGEKSLYARLFLTHNMVGIDDVFKADDNGNYLTGSEKISVHLPVLMAALNLKADDIMTIVSSPRRLADT